MKTIVTPVDFSSSSVNALEFAAELAKRTSARLLIIHALQNREDEDEAERKLKATQAELKKTFGAGLKTEIALRRDNLVAVMKKIIASQDPGLIVMGTKGATGLKRILIGSNTVNVMVKTKFPLLVIPEAARFKNYVRKGKSQIVLAADLKGPENENNLDILKQIALMIIEPKIKVLNVRPKKTKLNDLAESERHWLLSFFKPEIESERITVFSNDVISGINYYIKKHEDVKLVAMIARNSGLLLEKNYTRAMASHTHLPLLILHDRKMD